MNQEAEDLIYRLPHKPPMRFVSETLEADASGATCKCIVNDDLCRLFGDGDTLDTYSGIEILAQTSAIALAFDSSDQKPHAGMLMQVGKFESFISRVPKNSILIATTKIEKGLDGRVIIAKGSISLKDKTVCQAKLSIAIDRH